MAPSSARRLASPVRRSRVASSSRSRYSRARQACGAARRMRSRTRCWICWGKFCAAGGPDRHDADALARHLHRDEDGGTKRPAAIARRRAEGWLVGFLERSPGAQHRGERAVGRCDGAEQAVIRFAGESHDGELVPDANADDDIGSGELLEQQRQLAAHALDRLDAGVPRIGRRQRGDPRAALESLEQAVEFILEPGHRVRGCARRHQRRRREPAMRTAPRARPASSRSTSGRSSLRARSSRTSAVKRSSFDGGGTESRRVTSRGRSPRSASTAHTAIAPSDARSHSSAGIGEEVRCRPHPRSRPPARRGACARTSRWRRPPGGRAGRRSQLEPAPLAEPEIDPERDERP